MSLAWPSNTIGSEPVDELPLMVMWWIPAGTNPTIDEAVAKIHLLAENGPTDEAFTFRTAVPAPTE